jgi:general secretion pathway protein K
MSCRLGRRAESGFVLIAVLWMLAALATLASIYSAYAINTAAASHVPDDRIQAEASIRAAVEMTAFQALAVADANRPSQGGFSLRVGRTNLAVRFRSEAARVDLNAAPVEVLAGLFAALGVDSARAKTFADRVIGWRTKSDTNAASDVVSKEAKLYAAQGVPYPPRQAPFDSALELSLLPGVPMAVVERALPFVTVFSARAEIDPLAADPTVLSALPGMTPDILRGFLKARANPPADKQKLLDLLGPAKSHAAANGSKVFRCEIEVVFDGGRHIRGDVVFRLKDKSEEPFDLLYWRDDFDGPTTAS